jgi:hypothetical protein
VNRCPKWTRKDVKAAWELSREVEKGRPGVHVGIDWQLFERTCKPGADIQAVRYRTNHIWILRHVAPEHIEPWIKEDQLHARVFRAAAQVPMEWVGVGNRAARLTLRF